MIDWKTHSLINYFHNKNSEVVLKLINNETKEIEYKKEEYSHYFFIESKDVEQTQIALKDFIFVQDNNNEMFHLQFDFRNEGKYTKVVTFFEGTPYLYSVIKEIIKHLDAHNIKHYECDLLPGDNLILSEDTQISNTYRILYYDIETKDTQGGVEIGRDRILSICAVDNQGKEYKFSYDNEKETLTDFMKIVENYDMLISWNGKKFDSPYLKARLKVNNILFSFKSIIEIDEMLVFMASFAVKVRSGQKFLTSYSLSNVAKNFINDDKLKLDDDSEGYGGKLWKLFNENRQKLIAYNLQDCRLLKRLDEEFHLIENEIELAKLVKAPLSKTRSLTSMIDFLIIREARKRNTHMISKMFKDEVSKQYAGGYVLDAVPGLYEKVHIFDFASLYPSIVRTFNLSFDTLLDTNFSGDCIVTPNNIKYSKTLGIVPAVMNELTELRLKYKNEQQELKDSGDSHKALLKEFQQTAVKVLILGLYGITGAPHSRLFNLSVAETTTLAGQALIKSVIQQLDSNGFKVVMSDTDSVAFQILDDSRLEEAKLLIKIAINKIVKDSNTSFTNYLRMEHEKILSKFIVLAKKKYVGLVIAE